MNLKIEKAQRKTFTVEKVDVTSENLAAVAEWCGGVVEGKDEGQYVRITDKNAVNAAQTKAFPGDLVLKSPTGFKKYTKKNFEKSFEVIVEPTITHHEVPRDAGSGEYVTKEYAEANPDTTVVETVDIQHTELPHDADPS